MRREKSLIFLSVELQEVGKRGNQILGAWFGRIEGGLDGKWENSNAANTNYTLTIRAICSSNSKKRGKPKENEGEFVIVCYWPSALSTNSSRKKVPSSQDTHHNCPISGWLRLELQVMRVPGSGHEPSGEPFCEMTRVQRDLAGYRAIPCPHKLYRSCMLDDLGQSVYALKIRPSLSGTGIGIY